MIACLLLALATPIEADDSDWIGAYVACVDGACTRLVIGDDGLFRYDPSEGIGYDGSWILRNGICELTPFYDEEHEPFPAMPVTWLLIDWGARHYAVPQGRVRVMMNAINQGAEPRWSPEGELLIRKGDWLLPTRGRPSMPEEWDSLLLPEPISGTVVAIEDVDYLRISAGGNQGLQSGMELLAYDASGPGCCRLKVVCPCEDSARVEVIRTAQCRHDGLTRYTVGQQFTTSESVSGRSENLSDGGRIIWIDEMARLPARFESDTEALNCRELAQTRLAWRRQVPAIASRLLPVELAEIARWSPERMLTAQLPSGFLMELPMRPIGRNAESGEILLGHDLTEGPLLPAAGPVYRRLQISPVFDPELDRMTRVYVTIAGWGEE